METLFKALCMGLKVKLYAVELKTDPFFAMLSAIVGLVNEVWQVLKGLRYEDRYSLYGFWKGTAPNRYPELQVVTAATEKEAKSVMRRINKEDVKQYGRMFAKYAHSNPQIVFAAAMKQLEGGYDNMVQPLVDASKYLTDMGQDVLTYALLESLSKTTRSKVQDDGTSPAKWMISKCRHTLLLNLFFFFV